MPHYGEILINKYEVTVDYQGNPNFVFQPNSLFFFVQCLNENTIHEQWILRLEHDEGEGLFFDGEFAKETFVNHYKHYQEQFSSLDPEKSYFGQVSTFGKFILEENGNRNIYEKIDEYTTPDGIIKYNAIKMPLSSHDNYWIMDKEETYLNKEFFYFEPDKQIDSNVHHFGYEKFKPPKDIEVSELFVTYPKMLEVLECFFKKQPLSEELKAVYQSYKDDTYDAMELWLDLKEFPIIQVLDRVKELKIEQEEAHIMAEIERETALFKQDLIKKRLKR